MTGPAQDAQIEDLLRSSRRALNYLVSVESVLLALALAAVGVLGWKVLADESRLAASCSFYSDLGQAPVTAKSSTLAVKIISDSRASFRGQNCPGTLPAPSSELLRLAAADHVTIRY
jgi:hypothetical protein